MRRRPSQFLGFAVNLFSFGVSGITFLAAVSIAVICLAPLFSNRSLPQREEIQKPSKPKSDDLTSTAEKAEGVASRSIYGAIDTAREAGRIVRARPLIDVPPTPFAYLVEHLLGRGSQCPAPYNSFNKCLRQCSPSELNRPIGLKYWEKEEGEWIMRSVSEFTRTDDREDTGPTYKALYFSYADPPTNALTNEATILTLATPKNVAALVAAGADPELHYGEEGNTALIEAVQRGDQPKVEALLAAGARKNTRSAGSNQEPVNLVDLTTPAAKAIESLLR